VAIIVEAKTRIVGDFPGMAVEVAEDVRISAVEGLRRFACDFCAVRTGLVDDLVHFLIATLPVSTNRIAP